MGKGVEPCTDTKRRCQLGSGEPTGAIEGVEACGRNLNRKGTVWEDRCYLCRLGGGQILLIASVEALQSSEIIFVSGLCTIK
jgi:hypothetical protein